MFTLLNVFFHATHLLIIGFVLFGWAFKRARSIHLAVVALTIVSWFGLGFFFGWGYCFWTDWHWRVRDRLGLSYPSSYIKLFADSLTGRSWDPLVIDILTTGAFVSAIAITIYVNIRSRHGAS